MSRVLLAQDGKSLQYKLAETQPNTAKKLRQTEDIKDLYSFIDEHDLRREVYKILTTILIERRQKRI